MHGRYRQRARGILIVEVAVSLFVIALLTVLTMSTIMHFTKTRAHYARSQAAAWAAEAQLQRLRAGAPADSLPPEGALPDGITLAVRVTPGTGDWAELSLVCVRATAAARHERPVVEEVCGYALVEDAP